MRYFFTADCHFNHDNIIKYCSRPFKNSDHMNNELVRRWNERVTKDDIVFHLGDFGMGKNAYKFKDKLNGQIIFIRGNHDRNNKIKTRIKSIVLYINGHYYNLIHNPIECNVNYEIHLTGHLHEKWDIKRYKRGYSFTDCINVGVDQWNFYPVTIDEITKRYKQWTKKNSLPM